MIVDRLEERELAGLVERSARLRWNGGEFRMRLAVPPELAAPEGDGSPFLSAAVLPAMVFHEDLVVDAPVSPLLFRSVGEIQRIYRAWDPALRRGAVRVAEERVPARAPERLASFFSRGIDSSFTALAPRPTGQPALLLYCSTFDPFEGEPARAEQRRRARAAAERIGLPLAEVRMNVRELTERIIDFIDLHGAVLAALAQVASGGLTRALIASSHCARNIASWGSSPLLDPLFSTEAVRVEHDSLAYARLDKLAWLLRERPDVLGDAEVCQAQHRPGNCGRCSKCIRTAAALVAVGGTGAVPGVPARPDCQAIRRERPQGSGNRFLWVEILEALPDSPEHGELRHAIEHVLRRVARPGVSDWLKAARAWRHGQRRRLNPVYTHQGSRFSTHWTDAHIALLRFGRALGQRPLEPAGLPPAWEAPDGELTGLVRGLDLGARRHVYAVGAAPRGQLVGELGALARTSGAGRRAVWITADRRLSLSAGAASAQPASVAARARWALAPLGWRESGARLRAAALAGRALELARRRQRPLATSPGFEPAEPAGWLYTEDGPGRLPLYTATQRATGDQLLTRDPGEARDMGFGAAELLGYLADAAPITGSLAMQRLDVPWASRWGRRARAI